MEILVTGTAGFIGFFVADKLIKLGHQVVGIDNINDYYDVKLKFDRLKVAGFEAAAIEWNVETPSSLHNGLSFVRMNLEDKQTLFELAEKHNFDIVIHLAAQAGVRYSIQNPDAYVQSNIVGFLNILELSRNFKVQHLVYASSSSVYGLNEAMPFSVNQNVSHPVSLYAATKKSNELMAHSYSHLYNIPTSGLRFFTVYGSWGRPDMAYYLFANAISKGEAIKVFNNGKMKRDFTYIDDIVAGVMDVAFNPAKPNSEWNGAFPDPSTSTAPYRLYNIGSNAPVELIDFIKVIEKNIGVDAKMEMLEMQPGDVLSTWADVSELTEKFNYEPDTTIEVGIKHYMDWFKSYYA